MELSPVTGVYLSLRWKSPRDSLGHLTTISCFFIDYIIFVLLSGIVFVLYSWRRIFLMFIGSSGSKHESILLLQPLPRTDRALSPKPQPHFHHQSNE